MMNNKIKLIIKLNKKMNSLSDKKDPRNNPP